MKYIQKNPTAPVYLTQWIQQNQKKLTGKGGDEQWKFFKGVVKKRLQKQLLKEQGHICAYCNQRIHVSHPEDDQQMRIDHLEPKSHPQSLDKVFAYSNLVGSCFGNEREPQPKSLHCDPRKANLLLHRDLFPTDPLCEDQIEVVLRPDGAQLFGKRGDVDDSVQNVLNLNHPKLQELRKNALEAYNSLENNITPSEALALIEAYRDKDEDENFRPFSGIIITYLIQEYIA
ncbi:retron system putative HNH endonuclease [Haliscomenobacter hydrossis]|uniref:TIGR02646 family protein n=1 Tax=Haliscomenobacter hydrossis (strain ATCC 27775 / DSM 1100 / LMG 10767 / O) TaxID=760192 RepID=F4L2J7_HALH1|nr:retron system putative HNH endonuclease [Haliscomenobacter hydrossis]AEE53915.1 hypothetical protein Halhy_6093 [Haliscomenobacter hydrossis DSM 1100]